jgi:hypothetical protein
VTSTTSAHFLHPSLYHITIAPVLCRMRLTSPPHDRSCTLKVAIFHGQTANPVSVVSVVFLSLQSLISKFTPSFHHLQLFTSAGKHAPSPFNLSHFFYCFLRWRSFQGASPRSSSSHLPIGALASPLLVEDWLELTFTF